VITGWFAALDALLKADRAVVLIKVYYYGLGRGAAEPPDLLVNIT
jgi:hypothetical protein